ncbi:GmrSD restriction endonuclease domain-containing protein [Peribacillus sp. NPDC097197]|uniref:GmrSD restriction endonuclease domain-containing protein n=1 Tax=Peribacillus sp. NPDC097197 TaxID=3390615 RepID=UPI003D00FB1A
MEVKASETNFLKFLQGTKQFIIPIYQRKYSWTAEQCKQLWNDILRASKDDDIKGHFVGSIVYIEKGLYQISAVPQLLVIDGQQRMTTLTLLLLALGEAIKDSGQTFDITRKKIMNYYLVNNEEEDELYHKLLLTQTDKETLLSLINGKELPEEYSQRVFENFQFFLDQIRKSGIDLNLLYRGIAKLIVVDISLDRDHDNPQLIFESLNSTGLDLSQADLIRNYVLMKLDPAEQEVLYKNYWHPMEKRFGDLSESSLFDRFMRDYLTVKMGRIPNIRNVYADFKEYVAQLKEVDIETILKDIYQYSKYFVLLAFQTEKDKEINAILKDINSLKVDVSYPFLLEVYDDYFNQKVTQAEFISILKLVESYVFRRAICGVPTNSLNKTFATISKEINKEKYVESLQVILALKDSYKRFPNNEEFIRELTVKDVYNFRNRNYLLRKLENYNRKEIVEIESYTIEHIMPQNENMSIAWRNDLGVNWEEVHKTYLHSLGNLTLTRYNSELSDRPFKEKRDMDGGFADSPLRLNRGIGQLELWNEQEIVNRGKRLAEQAIVVWSYPELSEEVISQYKKKPNDNEKVKYTIDDFPELTGAMLELFEQLRKRICNLDSSVREEFKKLYIAYKTTTNFVDIVPQKSRLRLSLNMPFSEIHDPNEICKDVTNLGRWGNGDVEFGVTNESELEYAMFLVQQSFDKHRDEE